MASNIDYYELLGVARDADENQIKRAYYKLARKYHPDTNPDPESQAKFKTINDAYHVLKDPALRSKYDKYGVDGIDKEVFFEFTDDDFNEFMDITNLSEEDLLNEEKEKKKAKKLEKKQAKNKQKEEQKKKKEEEKKQKEEAKKQAPKTDTSDEEIQPSNLDLTGVDVSFTSPQQGSSSYSSASQSSDNSDSSTSYDYSSVGNLDNQNIVFSDTPSYQNSQAETNSSQNYYSGYDYQSNYSQDNYNNYGYQNSYNQDNYSQNNYNQSNYNYQDNSYNNNYQDNNYNNNYNNNNYQDNYNNNNNYNNNYQTQDNNYYQNSYNQDNYNQNSYNYNQSSFDYQQNNYSSSERQQFGSTEKQESIISDSVTQPNTNNSSSSPWNSFISNSNDSNKQAQDYNNVMNANNASSGIDNISNISKSEPEILADNTSLSNITNNTHDSVLQNQSESTKVNVNSDKPVENAINDVADVGKFRGISESEKEIISQHERDLPNFNFDKIIERLNEEAQRNKKILREMREISEESDLARMNDFYSEHTDLDLERTISVPEIIEKEIKYPTSEESGEFTNILALEMFNENNQNHLTKQVVTQQIRDYYDNLFAELSEEKIEDQSASAKIENTKQIDDGGLDEDLDIYIRVKIPQIFAFSKDIFKKIIYQRRIICSECGNEPDKHHKCLKCHGKGILVETVKLHVEIPIFSQSSYDLLYQGFGDVNSASKECGDLHIIFETIRSQYFNALPNGDVETAAMIPPIVGYLGGIVKVPTLEGLKKVNVDAGTQENDVIVVEEMGLPEHTDVNTGEKVPVGRLLVSVIFPKSNSLAFNKVDFKKTTLKELLEISKPMIDMYNSGINAELSYITKFKNIDDEKVDDDSLKTKRKTNKNNKKNLHAQNKKK